MTRIIYAAGTSGMGTRMRAKSWVGLPFKKGWCLFWCLVHVFQVPGLGDYDHDGDPDAEDYWKAAVKRGHVVHSSDPTEAPAGVLLCWVGGSHDNGHAAYALGDGEMVSTDLPTTGKVGRVSVKLPHERWGLTFVGWVVRDGNGITLVRTPHYSDPTPLPEPVHYTVTARDGLKGHKVPDANSPTTRLAKFGHHITAVATNEGGGRQWAVTKNGVHYAMTYLKAR